MVIARKSFEKNQIGLSWYFLFPLNEVYEADDQLVEAVDIFKHGQVHMFLRKFPNIYPEFAEMFKEAENDAKEYIAWCEEERMKAEAEAKVKNGNK